MASELHFTHQEPKATR